MSLLDKMKETAQKGVDKTKEAVSAGQDKLEAHKLERRISDLKEELGGLVYAHKTGASTASPDAEIARIVDEISKTETDLAAYDQAPGEASGEAPGEASGEAPS
jgi:hypothetical protein